MKLFLTSSEPQDEVVRHISAELGAALGADAFEEADVALYIESATMKFRDYPSRLLATEPVRRDPSRCVVFDISDWPTPFLPGVYVSLPRSRFDEPKCASGSSRRSTGHNCPVTRTEWSRGGRCGTRPSASRTRANCTTARSSSARVATGRRRCGCSTRCRPAASSS